MWIMASRIFGLDCASLHALSSSKYSSFVLGGIQYSIGSRLELKINSSAAIPLFFLICPPSLHSFNSLLQDTIRRIQRPSPKKLAVYIVGTEISIGHRVGEQ